MTSPTTSDRVMRPRILEVSRQLCEEQSGPGLTIRSIAGRIGVSTTVIYRCFEGKPDILRALREDALERLHACVRDGMAVEQTAIRRFHGVCARYLEFAFAYPRVYDLLLMDRAAGAGSWEDSRADAFANMLADCVGDLVPPDPRNESSPNEAAILLWAALHGLVEVMRRMQATPEARLEIIHEYVEMLAHALVRPIDQRGQARYPADTVPG